MSATNEGAAVAAAPPAPRVYQCPLCRNDDPAQIDPGYHQDKRRTYAECLRCSMVFVPRWEHIPPAEEKSRYDTHQNDCNDAGYCRFLMRTGTPVLTLLARKVLGRPLDEPIDFASDAAAEEVKAAEAALVAAAGATGAEGSALSPLPLRAFEGIDFGCGPGPTLSKLLERSVLVRAPMALYDLFYFPDDAALAATYDFVTCTEVIEHLADTGAVCDKLWSMVRPGGVLALMTKRVSSKAAFAKWHYKNDETHISFFHERGFRGYLAARWEPASVHFHAADVVVFTKKGGGQ
jgi:SAM-dependent methyltransferase